MKETTGINDHMNEKTLWNFLLKISKYCSDTQLAIATIVQLQ